MKKKFNDFLAENTVTNESVALINEAKFSNANLKKVSALLAKIASKKLGANFQFGWLDDFKKSSGESGIGFRYMSPEGQQIRFNHVTNKNSFAVNSVDYWKKGATLTEPNTTIFFAEGVNIVKLTSQLWDALRTGKVPTIQLKDIVNESTDLQEAKPSDRRAFAEINDIPISYTNGGKDFQQALEKRGLEAEWDEYMSVKINDSEKTQFDYALNENQKRLDSSDKNFYANPKYVFDDIREATKVVAKGKWRSLIIAGMGGIGKTFGVKDILTKEYGPYEEGPGGKWAYYEGMKGSALGYYMTFLMNKKKIVVIDDSDSIWYKGNVNFMKIITSDSGDRAPSFTGPSTANVSLMSNQEREIYEAQWLDAVVEDPNTTFKPPSKFNFEGSFINISNMKGEEFDGAIKSRSIFIDVYLAERDVIRRMATIMEFQGRSQERIMDVLSALNPEAKDALDGTGRYSETPQYMTPEEARKNKQLNMRSVGITDALAEAGAKDWRRMAGLYS